MKTLAVLLSLFLSPALSFTQRTRPIAPGQIRAQQAEERFEKSIPRPLYQSSSANVVQLRKDADDLAGLAQSVPADIAQTTRGMLPKDLDQKLKRIEKLAKHLRSAISR